MNAPFRLGPNRQLPIPEDVKPGPGWTAEMVEMADHIGPYATMLVVERYGGERINFTEELVEQELTALIGGEAAQTLRHVYLHERVYVPVASNALSYARRQPIVAAARAKLITMAEAARLIRTSRYYMSHLVNQTTEGTGAVPPPELAKRRPKGDPRQINMFPEDAG
jgi:hypothetical protein